MSVCAAFVIALASALTSFGESEEDSDVPVAAWKVPADATRPANGPGAGQDFGPRVGMAEAFLNAASTTDGTESSALGNISLSSISPTYHEDVAATVNGERILNGEVLGINCLYAFGVQRRGLPHIFYKEQLDAAIQRDLPRYIQQRLVIEEIASKLPINHVEKFQVQIRRSSKSALSRKPIAELEQLSPDEQSLVLQYVNKDWSTGTMAKLLLARWIKENEVTEQEQLAYFDAHLQDYVVPAQVDWEQIQVSFVDDASKAAVQSVVTKAQRELESETSDAADVVSKYSDGPTANSGGKMTTSAGSLTDAKLERMLFEMPTGAWSGIYEGPTEFQLVRVQARRPAKQLSFAETKETIQKKLTAERINEFVEQLYQHAKIETKFDLAEFQCLGDQLAR